MHTPKLFLCIPAMDELANLPSLIQSLQLQETEYPFKTIFCINHPEAWAGDSSKKDIVENNRRSIDYLRQVNNLDIEVIDRSGSGKGWDNKNYGVGWARKTAMDYAGNQAENDDLIFSMDADTFYPPEYLRETTDNLLNHPDAMGIAIPYYHPLPGSETAARAMLRYEMYMRHYALNMWRIESPYKFTALGSAMALPVWAYRKVGGITPKIAGEDFYFLQKLRKSGKILHYNPVKAFPEARFSDRVIFGTGPAMIKGAENQWESYPIYHPSLFDEIKEINDAFGKYYDKTLSESVLSKIHQDAMSRSSLEKLRKNSTSREEFIKKCHIKFDGLRTLQYLKKNQTAIPQPGEHILRDYLLNTYREAESHRQVLEQLSFRESAVADLNNIRNLMVKIETKIIRNDHNNGTYSYR